MINLRPYTDDSGQINMCAAFYDYMERRKRGVKRFAEAITYLENMMDVEPVTSEQEALGFISEAVDMAYSGAPK